MTIVIEAIIAEMRIHALTNARALLQAANRRDATDALQHAREGAADAHSR